MSKRRASTRLAGLGFELAGAVAGFALVLLTLSLWVIWGRRGVQREPMSGPPMPALVPWLAKVGGRKPEQAPGPGLASG